VTISFWTVLRGVIKVTYELSWNGYK